MTGNAKTIEANDRALNNFKAKQAADLQRQSAPGRLGQFAQNARSLVGELKLVMPRLKVTAYDGFEKGVKAAADAHHKTQADKKPTMADKVWDVVFGNKSTPPSTTAHGSVALHDKKPRKPMLTP